MFDFRLLKEKKEIIKPLAIIALILILDFSFVLRGQIIFLNRSISRVNKLRKEINIAKKGIRSGGGLLKPGDRLKLDVFREENKIIAEQEIPLFLSELAKLAQEANVKLMQIKPAKLTKHEANDAEGRLYFRLPIDLDLSCGYHPLGIFINRLETAQKYISILKLDVASVADAPFEYPVKMTIEVLVVRK